MTFSVIFTFTLAVHVFAAPCANPNDDGSCSAPGGDSNALLQSKVTVQETMNVEVDMSQNSVNTRHAARARLGIEQDLRKLHAMQIRAYSPDDTLDENVRTAFNDFLDTSGLRNELTAEEITNWLDRLLAACEAVFKSGTDDWETRLADAIEEEKPEISDALEASINDAHLGFTVKIQEWMKNQSKHDFEAKLGTTTEGLSASFLEESRANKGSFDSLDNVNPPESMDYATQFPSCAQTIRRIHNQGTCGSCWAFGALSALDSRLCIKTNGAFTGDSALISRTYVTSCTYDRNGCQGGWMTTAYNKMKTESTAPPTGGPSGCVPYFGHGEGTDHFDSNSVSPPCPTQCLDSTHRSLNDDRYHFPNMQFHDTGIQWHGDTATNRMKATLYRDGPVSYAMYASNAFMGYSSGVFADNCNNGNANHAVTAIGYGKTGDTVYVNAINSWGPGWGDNGGFKQTICSVYVVALFDFGTDHVPDPLFPGAPTPATTQAPTPATTQAPTPATTQAPTPATTQAPTPASTQAPAPPPPAQNQPWTLEDSSAPCAVLPNGCITSGNYQATENSNSKYRNREYCSFSVTPNNPPEIEVENFATENNYDKIQIDSGAFYSGDNGGNQLQGVRPTASIVWSSDFSVKDAGWMLCPRREDSATTQAPTPATTQAPTPATTQAPASSTQAPTPATTQAPVPVTTQAPTPATTQAPVPVTTQEPSPDSAGITADEVGTALRNLANNHGFTDQFADELNNAASDPI